MRRVPSFLLLACLAIAFSSAGAQSYPNRPVKVVVGFPPGGPTDIMGRLFAQKLTEAFRESFIVENRPGAGTTIASEFVARSPADGHTLLIATLAGQVVAPILYPKLSYDVVKDFTPIAHLSNVPNLLAVHPSLPVKTVNELVAYIRERPGKLNYANTGSGTSQHLAAELLKSMAKLDFVLIGYKGSAPALVDLLAGQTQFMTDNTSSIGTHVRSGKLRGLAVTSTTRVPAYPDLPTMDEAGLPGYEIVSWFGLSAPAGTSKEIVNRIAQESAGFLRQPDVVQKLADLGATPVGSTPEQFAEMMRSETAKWVPIIRAAGIKIQ